MSEKVIEADELCRRIAVINNGRIVAMDTPHGLKGLVKDTAAIFVGYFMMLAFEYLARRKGTLEIF